MEKLFEKVATELDKAADYIEKHETAEKEEQEKVATAKADEESKKRDEVIAPIKAKLAEIADDDEISAKLQGTPTDALELISKSLFSKKADDETVHDDWGHVEESKHSHSKSAKHGGYADPLEAFAMGN